MSNDKAVVVTGLTRTRGWNNVVSLSLPDEAYPRHIDASRGGRRYCTELRRCALVIALSSLLPLHAAWAQSAPSTDGARNEGQAEATREAGAIELDRIEVTGTRIRGGATPSPVVTLGSERIREEGFADLGEVVRSLPQNFGGGQNPGVGSGGFSGAGLANQNVTGGASLNLRGLGPDATLTLLNGRRMAYSGFVQAVDISAIPVEAVDRIEVVADGASAIYGSDAVGGVGNVILRRDFDGVAVSTRHGRSADGGLGTQEYALTAGTYWRSGGLIAAYRDVSVDPIHASQRGYTDHLGPNTTIYPGSELRSGLLSGHQALGDALELRLDALHSRRDQHYGYDYLGINRSAPETTTTLVSPSLELRLPGDWTLSAGGTWAKDEHDEHQTRENTATGVITVVVNDCYCNESRTYELGAEGPLHDWAAGEVRLAVGAGYRRNSYRQRSHTTGATTMAGDESARFAYAELDVPLVGPGQGITGVRRLSVTGAVRGEDYSSFGRVTTPKLGLVYSPDDNLTAKASWGRSFKAPTLFQIHQMQMVQIDRARNFGGVGYGPDAMVLRGGGGNPDLEPERARTWSASLAYHPTALPGMELELTTFDIDYTDRVVQPIVGYAQVMANPVYAPLISHAPSLEEQQRLLANARFFNFTGVAYDPQQVVAIIHGQYLNVASQRIKGMDLSGSYRFDVRTGRLTVRGAATRLDSTQQSTSRQEPFDLAGTLFNPPTLSGRVGTVWDQGGLTASAFANYTGGVTNTADRRKTASFTTVDATLRYATERRDGALSGVAVTLSAQNLLDRAPPLHRPAEYAAYTPPYDATNYSAIGRFMSLSLSKRF